jgi:hypothetical protein
LAGLSSKELRREGADTSALAEEKIRQMEDTMHNGFDI